MTFNSGLNNDKLSFHHSWFLAATSGKFKFQKGVMADGTNRPEFTLRDAMLTSPDILTYGKAILQGTMMEQERQIGLAAPRQVSVKLAKHPGSQEGRTMVMVMDRDQDGPRLGSLSRRTSNSYESSIFILQL